jgi:ligand-binding sensor domain-containing protein/signal transduction histidine kinase
VRTLVRAAAVGGGLLLAVAARAERLPLRGYTTEDGLPHDRVGCVAQDARGYLWFCTAGGLALFDGYRFTTFGREHGLPGRAVHAFVETAPGEYWVGTEAGLCRLDAAASRCLPRALPGGAGASVHALRPDGRGLWAAAGNALYVSPTTGADAAFQAVPLPRPLFIHELARADDGSLWLASSRGLWRRRPSGTVELVPLSAAGDGDEVWLVDRDPQGRLWVSAPDGLVVLRPDARGDVAPVAEPGACPVRLDDLPPGGGCRRLPAALPRAVARAIVHGADGVTRVGTQNQGLVTLAADGDLRHTVEQGLANDAIRSLLEDRDGNLWIGTEAHGIQKTVRAGFVSFGRADGFENGRIVSIFGGTQGDVHVVNAASTLFRFDGRRFEQVHPRVEGSFTGPLGFGHRVALQDREARWWIAGEQGLLRFPGVGALADLARVRPRPVEGGGGAPAGPLHEDAHGDVWAGGADGAVLRWERATGRLRVAAVADRPWGRPSAFAEARGGLWVGFSRGVLARLRDGRLEPLALPGPRTQDRVAALYRDRAGGLWVAAGRSVPARVEDDGPGAPRVTPFARDEAAGVHVQAVTEDAWGRIYFGTDAGVDRLDPRTGQLRHFGTADGLAAVEVTCAFVDALGRQWFGTRDGLSMLQPQEDPPARAPEVRVRALRVAGTERPLSALGETRIGGLTLAADEAQIEIEYAALGLRMGESLRYRYRLEGADAAFAAPTLQRTVNYARLAPGRYRFVVEASASDGAVGSPASVEFRVLPPFWLRATFLAPAALLAGLLLYGAFRYRLRALLELERVRTGIATDLHDDIGSSLSKIAILSEVVRRDAGPGASGQLGAIADISRELVDSMSDIVWAVNPRRDSLLDLTQRMRAFATEIFSAQGVALRFEAPADDATVPIPTGLRRQVFLVFKEAVTNAARHSACRGAQVVLAVAHGVLSLTVADDGSGIVEGPGDGHGLAAMAARARALGGSLAVESSPGGGTRVVLSAPLARRRWTWGRAT